MPRDNETIHVNSCADVRLHGKDVDNVRSPEDMKNYLEEKASEVERSFYAKTVHLQLRFQNGQWRFYGNVVKGKPTLYLCIEFIYFLSDEKVRDGLRAFAKDYKGKIRTIDSCKHLDKWQDAAGKHHVGKNHGRPERHIEIIWDVWKWSDEDIKDKIDRLTLALGMNKLWKKAGLAVL